MVSGVGASRPLAVSIITLARRTFRDGKESREDPENAAQCVHGTARAEQGDDLGADPDGVPAVAARAQRLAQLVRGYAEVAMEGAQLADPRNRRLLECRECRIVCLGRT